MEVARQWLFFLLINVQERTLIFIGQPSAETKSAIGSQSESAGTQSCLEDFLVDFRVVSAFLSGLHADRRLIPLNEVNLGLFLGRQARYDSLAFVQPHLLAFVRFNYRF